MFQKNITVRSPMPGCFLLPCSLDKVQGRQTWPPLVPKNLSRLLTHKVLKGRYLQDKKTRIFWTGKQLHKRWVVPGKARLFKAQF